MHRNPGEIYGASCRDEDRKDFGGRGEGWYGRPRHRDSYKTGMLIVYGLRNQSVTSTLKLTPHVCQPMDPHGLDPHVSTVQRVRKAR